MTIRYLFLGIGVLIFFALGTSYYLLGFQGNAGIIISEESSFEQPDIKGSFDERQENSEIHSNTLLSLEDKLQNVQTKTKNKAIKDGDSQDFQNIEQKENRQTVPEEKTQEKEIAENSSRQTASSNENSFSESKRMIEEAEQKKIEACKATKASEIDLINYRYQLAIEDENKTYKIEVEQIGNYYSSRGLFNSGVYQTALDDAKEKHDNNLSEIYLDYKNNLNKIQYQYNC